MEHRLRVHSTIAQDQNSDSTTHVPQLTTSYNSTFRGHKTFFWTVNAYVYIYTQADMYNL